LEAAEAPRKGRFFNDPPGEQNWTLFMKSRYGIFFEASIKIYHHNTKICQVTLFWYWLTTLI